MTPIRTYPWPASRFIRRRQQYVVAAGLLLTGVMRVRITRAPRGVVDGMSMHYYHAGEAYDVSPELAEYLVAAGYASIEMRQHQRSSRPRGHERRRSRACRA